MSPVWWQHRSRYLDCRTSRQLGFRGDRRAKDLVGQLCLAVPLLWG